VLKELPQNFDDITKIKGLNSLNDYIRFYNNYTEILETVPYRLKLDKSPYNESQKLLNFLYHLYQYSKNYKLSILSLNISSFMKSFEDIYIILNQSGIQFPTKIIKNTNKSEKNVHRISKIMNSSYSYNNVHMNTTNKIIEINTSSIQNHIIKPVDIEALGWSDEQLAAEDKEAMENSPLCKQLGDGTGPIVLIGEENPAQPTVCTKDNSPACDDMAAVDNCDKLKPRSTDGEAPNSPVPMTDEAENLNKKPEDDMKEEYEKDLEPKMEAYRVDNTSEDGKKGFDEAAAPENEEPQKQKKNKVKLSPKKGGKKKGKGKNDGKSDSGSSEEQTSSITLTGSQSDSDQDGTDSSDESTSEITADLMMSSSTDGPLSPSKKDPAKSHHHKRSTENGKKKPPAEGKKSKNKPKP